MLNNVATGTYTIYFYMWFYTGVEFFPSFGDGQVERDSSDGIATRYGLEGPGIETSRGEIFHTCPDRPWGPPSLLYNGYRVLPGCKSNRVLR
jgi:hypothetical protein